MLALALRHAVGGSQLVVGAAVVLAGKSCDSPRPVKHVAYHWFRVKNANKAEELAAAVRGFASRVRPPPGPWAR